MYYITHDNWRRYYLDCVVVRWGRFSRVKKMVGIGMMSDVVRCARNFSKAEDLRSFPPLWPLFRLFLSLRTFHFSNLQYIAQFHNTVSSILYQTFCPSAFSNNYIFHEIEGGSIWWSIVSLVSRGHLWIKKLVISLLTRFQIQDPWNRRHS